MSERMGDAMLSWGSVGNGLVGVDTRGGVKRWDAGRGKNINERRS